MPTILDALTPCGNMKKEWKRQLERNRKLSEKEYSAQDQKWYGE